MKFELMVETAAFGSQYCHLACLYEYVVGVRACACVCVCFFFKSVCYGVVKSLTIQSWYLILYKESYRLDHFLIIEFLS